MVRTLWAVVFLGALSAAARAGDRPPEPKGPPPSVLLASVNAKGELVLRVLLVEYKRQTRDRVVIRNGRKTTVPDTIEIPVFRSVDQAVPTAGLRVFDVEGNKVDLKTLRKRLSRRTPVVISGDGKPVDPAYLTVFKKDTLVLVLPPPEPVPPPKKD